jgi:hypothetical protein
MVERRDLMSGGLMASFAALMTPAEAEAAAQQSGDEGVRVARAVTELQEGLERELQALRNGPWGTVTRIREQQRSWLRATQRYPEFIEVGLDAWDGLHDWHVRYQQPINVARMADGRYAMVFMFTTIVLRPEQALDYVGLPYDADRGR